MKRRRLIAAGGAILLLVGSTTAWSFIRNGSRESVVNPARSVGTTLLVQSKNAQALPRPRNLSLQPEALAMSKRLGSRFAADKRETSVLVGTLVVGSEKRTIQTKRTQTDDGEQIEIKIAGSGPSLTWDANQGCLTAGSRSDSSDRELIERLVFDSPDQFVLAQLRAASYRTISVNVRPDKAGDNYRGPLWNIVRLDDPQTDPTKAPQSRWRLFYVNVITGLIDRIESEVQGQRIASQIESWAESNGEKVPSEITWTREGQVLMHYSLNNFSHADK